MAILENEILVTLNSANIKRYEQLKYEIPKTKDKWGRMKTPRGTKILVNIADLTNSCNEKVTKICDECGKHVPEQIYQDILKNRSYDKDRCLSCSSKISWLKRKDNIDYQKTFEFYAINNNMNYLLNEFSAKNNRNPNKISKGTNTKYWWNCPICKSEYDLHIHRRLKGDNCPYCSGHRVNHTNCMTNSHPNLTKEWHPILNGSLTTDQVSYGMGIKVWWKCLNGHQPFQQSINTRTCVKSGCPLCAESKGEKVIRKWLDKNLIPYDSQKEYEGLIGTGGGNLSFDFYLSKQNILIEYQGEFHDGSNGNYTKINLENQKEHDGRKKKFAGIHNIKLLEIWYWDFDNIEEILEQYINNEIAAL